MSTSQLAAPCAYHHVTQHPHDWVFNGNGKHFSHGLTNKHQSSKIEKALFVASAGTFMIAKHEHDWGHESHFGQCTA